MTDEKDIPTIDLRHFRKKDLDELAFTIFELSRFFSFRGNKLRLKRSTSCNPLSPVSDAASPKFVTVADLLSQL